MLNPEPRTVFEQGRVLLSHLSELQREAGTLLITAGASLTTRHEEIMFPSILGEACCFATNSTLVETVIGSPSVSLSQPWS